MPVKRKRKHEGIAEIRCDCGVLMERVGGSHFSLTFHCGECDFYVQAVFAKPRSELNLPTPHTWVVSEDRHPFLTGWKCTKCGRKTSTQDDTDEKPHSKQPCKP